MVSAIVQVDNKATLYIGNIYDYAMDKNGTLDYLLLRNVSRWNLKEYEDAKNVQEILNAAFPIKGKNFVLRYSETITLSINYLNLSDASIVHNE